MGRLATARVVILVAALSVAAGLLAVESDRDSCESAARQAYADAQAPPPVLNRDLDAVVRECGGSEPLMRVSLALLQIDRPRPAGRLARVASVREPDSYYAWAVLALTEPPRRAAAASARARSLNPIAARAGGP